MLRLGRIDHSPQGHHLVVCPSRPPIQLAEPGVDLREVRQVLCVAPAGLREVLEDRTRPLELDFGLIVLAQVFQKVAQSKAALRQLLASA